MREINEDGFFRIFNSNTNFKIKSMIYGNVVEMSSKDAFIYSNITGAVFLDNTLMPFTPKGLMKVFSSEKNLRNITGLWDRGKPHFTPRNLSRTRAFLQSNNKLLIPIKFENEIARISRSISGS